MAVTTGTVWSVEQVKGPDQSDLQLCRVLFTMSGTYAQADNSKLAGVPTLIQDSKSNGKTVTMRYVMCGSEARKTSDNAIMALSSVTISSSDVTFALTDGDYSTELADGAIPGQSVPFSIYVAYTEA